MLIVTGTKRSGTSMWMQILKAAGFPVLGTAFPKNWASSIREANQEGFYESPLRGGIYYATNPHPKTGLYLFPEDTRRAAVKVFVPGLVRSDRAFIDRVIATMRSVREYGPSISRLYAMEHEHKQTLLREQGKDPSTVPVVEHVPPELEWWSDNYALLSDALTRRYPLHMVSYDAVLTRPSELIPEAIAWLGGGDNAAAVAVVQAELRTQRVDKHEEYVLALDDDIANLCDELYRRVHEREPLTGDFIDALNAADERMHPRIKEARRRAHQSRLAARRRRRPQ